ncbi:MAG TPA: NAD(P)-binding domain-containing protein [Acidisoma sp.]|uniref:NAD(P)-binding domain-containing protein n=1 Tax=Acidisoma sp. TaxID=1872115 RepID=UPI002BBED974|nr:NAD(P)-binding domain-containing protein [Acidisoma sp.]HTI02730.1 NAD(P)-binding domain-containing protein [Acidisoma sp.]
MAILGFVGTGTLADAVIRGLQKTEAQAHRFLLSPRSETRSRALAREFDNTKRAESNEAVVAQSDIVLLGVLPKQIGELGALPFRADQIVVSFLAGVPVEVVRRNIAPATRVVRMIPLPCIEFGKGPILMTPADAEVEAIFGKVGELVIPDQESDLDAISIASGLMSAHFQMQNTVVAWLQSREIVPALASRYVRSLYSGLGELALEMDRKGDALPPEEYETRGGLNETARAFLNHEGWFDDMARALDRVEAHRRTLMKPAD